MKRWSAGEVAGLVVPMGAVIALLAGTAAGELRLIESPIVLAGIGLALAAVAGVLFRFIGLFCAAVALAAVAIFASPRISETMLLAFQVPALAAAIGTLSLGAYRLMGGLRQRRAMTAAAELNRLRERLADLEAASRAGSPMQVLSAASREWMGLADEVAESGVALIARLPEALLDRAEAKRFVTAIRGLRRGIVAQEALSGAIAPSPAREARLASAVEKGVAAAADTCAAHGVVVETDLSQSGPPCVLDADLVAIAVAAVVANAAEASPRGATVSVLAHADWRGERGLIEISDRGSGIAPDNMALVFKPFYTTRPGRLGLGLAMAKEVLQRVGGSIAVSANESRGMTFRIRIPMRRPEVMHESTRAIESETEVAPEPATVASVERAAKGSQATESGTNAAEAEIAVLTRTIELAKAAAEARREAKARQAQTED